MEEAADVDSADAAARFDADFALMGMELARFIPAVVEAYGALDEG
jgi:recombination associated protein RdgC